MGISDRAIAVLINGVPTAMRSVRITRVSVPFAVLRFNSGPDRLHHHNLSSSRNGNDRNSNSNRNSNSDVNRLRHKRQQLGLASYDSSWVVFVHRSIR